MTPQVRQYWDHFRSQTGFGGAQPFDVFKIGNSIESADAGLALVMSGKKTATSCLPEEFAHSRPPQAGDLSIITDGRDIPGGVVETTDARLLPFDEVSEEFANAYGEWDRTLETWRDRNAGYYKEKCEHLGITWHGKRKLVLERFRVIYRNEMTGTAASA